MTDNRYVPGSANSAPIIDLATATVAVLNDGGDPLWRWDALTRAVGHDGGFDYLRSAGADTVALNRMSDALWARYLSTQTGA